MSNILIATIAGLFTAVAWGAGDWLTPRSKHKLSVWQINFVVNLVGSVLFIVILAFARPHWPTDIQVAKLIGASVLISTGYLIFVKALTIGDVGIVVPLSSIYPMLSLILSIVFLHQVYSHSQVASMGIIILGAVLLSYEKNRRGVPLSRLHQASLLTLCSVLLWGIGFFILNPLISQVPWQMMLAVLEFIGLVIASFYLVIIYKRDVVQATRNALTDKTTLESGLILGVGSIALYMGAHRLGNLIIPATISSLSPLISTALEVAVDKKKLGLLKRLGAIVAVGGIVLLNIS